MDVSSVFFGLLANIYMKSLCRFVEGIGRSIEAFLGGNMIYYWLIHCTAHPPSTNHYLPHPTHHLPHLTHDLPPTHTSFTPTHTHHPYAHPPPHPLPTTPHTHYPPTTHLHIHPTHTPQNHSWPPHQTHTTPTTSITKMYGVGFLTCGRVCVCVLPKT
jgi:hypothetical protein